MAKKTQLSFIPEILPGTESKVRSFRVRTRWISEGDLRIDASFHADDAVRARHLLEATGFKLKNLGDSEVSEGIFNLYRFKRIYTTIPEKGYPYLSASETIMFRLRSNRWIAQDKAPKQANRHFAKAGWILVSCSGVLGRCVLVTERMEKFFLTHDLIRIIPILPAGYIYAFLSTWLGQALILREEYGGTISHLEASHLVKIPIPLLAEHRQKDIHLKILKAYQLRDEANRLLNDADGLLHYELGLNHFDELQINYFGDVTKPKTFVLKSSELDSRIDASFHSPIVKSAIAQLERGKYPLAQLGRSYNGIAKRIFIPNRFKRIYVPPEYGVPFLQGSHIPLMRPYNLRYLSTKIHADLSPYTIHSDWILITRSGTVGRIALVPKLMDGWVASEHILRVIVNPLKAHPGYLATFLTTPYGQHQLASKIYGGVVDELTEDDAAQIWIPDAPLEVQERIGALASQAYKKKEEANLIEEECIRGLEETLTSGIS